MTSDEINDTRDLQRALERTVPASEFCGEATARELTHTRQDEGPQLERTQDDLPPDATPQQYLRRTSADTPIPQDDSTDESPGFGTTSLVPPDLLDDGEPRRRRFELIGQVGSGGTAKVYAVRDTGLGRTIALKLLHARKANRPGTKRRFLHEARVTAMLEHPNIVPVHDIGVTDRGQVYFLMKNVTGTTLGEVVRAATEGQAVPPELDSVDGVLRVILKVCDALAYAHSRGYIHQDVKPDNIILGDFGEVLLLDWGCAIAKEEQDKAGAATFGTPAYMAPEQARREPVDERSDVYCVGGTLYHLLTLRHPTFEEDPERFWEMKRRGDLSVLPSENERRAPPALLDIAYRSMAPDPAQRYQSVVALRDALIEYQTHAESIALARQAAEQIPQAEQNADYAALTDIGAQLSQALKMWPGNAEARAALVRARRAHAQCALARGELALAESLIAREPELADLRSPLGEARRRLVLRKRRSRRIMYAAALLGLVTLGFFGYGIVDYFRYVGRWQPVYRADLTGNGEPVDGLTVSRVELTRDEATRVVTGAQGSMVPTEQMIWLSDVRELGDVRVELCLRWPDRVDGLEVCINTRREEPPVFWQCPSGYACQFGGWSGTVNLISRNDKPQAINTGNAVAAAFEPGRVYRLWFQRVGEEVSLHVDRREVFSLTQPLPMVGHGLDRVAFRSWAPVEVLSMQVWRMGSPAKASPLIAGDVLVELGHFADAVRRYRRIASDHAGTRIAEQALTRAYLLAGALADADTVLRAVRMRMQERYPSSKYWPLLFEADCERAWGKHAFDSALTMASKALERDPDSRIALRLLSRRPPDLPASAAQGLLHLLGRSSKVRTLDVSNMGLSDLSPIRTLDLVSLNCSGNDLTEITPLAGMPLRQLNLNDNRVASLAPLAGMQLQELNATGNRIEDLSVLADMPMAALECAYNPIRSIEPLRGLPLRELRADSCGLTDLEPLGAMKLEMLSIGYNAITDLSPLRGMPLEDLNCRHNRIGTLEPLRGSPLAQLDCSANAIADIMQLRGAPLRRLLADSNRVSDLRPLAGAPLDELFCLRNPLASLAPFEHAAPPTFAFDSVQANDEYVASVLRTWTQRGDSSNARLSRAMIALRRGSFGSLRSLAVPRNGRRYLYVGLRTNHDDASRIARAAGGHLVTITSADEQAFVLSLMPRNRSAWLGLARADGVNRWVTGEPFSYQKFNYRRDTDNRLPAIQLRGTASGEGWTCGPNDDWTEDIVIEWEQ